MSGRGKGLGKGLGKGSAKRHKKTGTTTLQISSPSIRRLARRAGVPRLSSGVYQEVNNILVGYLSSIVRLGISYCSHAKRKTVQTSDVMYALKRSGTKILGY
ncbi:Histone H4 [Spraguea lophii 42_110]|uniref:Histone H4 n=1 Tax=Spraguea lophii (strain 42_110) TaxID=1358809 RepID=S7W8N5_SPRLO|nr:Histone H4 [Spraguea lophii 42_110]